ncbi:MAG: ArsR/SmtB family transcription factor [Candidatus Neomarinimicrobiota bacterium]
MSDSLSKAARLLKVLGHPARLHILHFIEDSEKTVNAIQEHVGLTQAMTSQHLKVLYEVGLIQRRRQGTSVFYSVTGNLGRKLLRSLHGCRELWSGRPVERAK